jgi:hypothetical protein
VTVRVRLGWLSGLVTLLALTGCTAPVTVPARPAAEFSSAPDSVVEVAADYVLEGVLPGRGGAILALRDAASSVDLRLVELPGLLYRVSTPAESGLAPRVTGPPGVVRVALAPTGADGPDAVTILLNRSVLWDIRLPAGAGEQHLDLTGGRLARLDLGAGAGLVDVRLPRPEGSIPVTVTGAIGSLAVATPDKTAIRLHLRAGAGAVAAPGYGMGQALPGSVLLSGHWKPPEGRYVLDAEERIDLLALRN